MIHSRSSINVNENLYDKYKPEYKTYKDTKEQVSELNNYLNPIDQFLYKDKPQIINTLRLLSLQKYQQIYYNNNKRYNDSEIGKEKIILKNDRNNNILISNNFKISNDNSSINVRRFEGLKKIKAWMK